MSDAWAEPAPRKQRQLPDVLTDDEVDRLLAAPNIRTHTGLRDRAIMEVALRAGLRVSEICDLRADAVDLDTGWLHVRHGKRDKSRDIAIGPRLAPWLQRWVEIRPESPYFFCSVWSGHATGNPPGQRLSRQAIGETFRRYADKAGVAPREEGMHPARPHGFRHKFATEAVRAGVSVFVLQKLMGHADSSTTSLYLHMESRDVADAMAQIG